jgi:hypothetical protein
MKIDNTMRGNMAKKMCEICGKNPATVPDRERPGRLINRICKSCHMLRLRGDMDHILELHKKCHEEVTERK